MSQSRFRCQRPIAVGRDTRLGQLSLRGQEQLVALRPCGRGLILEVLRYADEVNKAADYFREVGSTKPDADLLDLAETLIGKKSGDFDAADYENHYVEALKRVIAKKAKAKAKGKRVLEDVDEPAAADRGSNVIDLMAALIHVVVPLDPGHDWDAHKAFSKHFAEALSMAEPDRFVATMSKAKRKGRIFIDWLRNQRGSTAVMPYSARARPRGPVAVPVGWEALAEIKSADAWTIADAGALLDHAASAEIRGWGFAAQSLPDY